MKFGSLFAGVASPVSKWVGEQILAAEPPK